jgi:putative endonuclease
MQRSYFVYILASGRNGTLYVGVTNDIARRVYEHKQGITKGFTKKYDVRALVYFEMFDDIGRAISREKTIKGWPRRWKMNKIEEANPMWRDLYEELNC